MFPRHDLLRRRVEEANASAGHRLIDALHLACIVHAGYHYAVSNYGNTLAMLNVTWCVLAMQARYTSADGPCRSLIVRARLILPLLLAYNMSNAGSDYFDSESILSRSL